LIEQLGQIHNKSIEEVLDEVCGYFPTPVSVACLALVNTVRLEISLASLSKIIVHN
jgi:hypothetical protein